MGKITVEVKINTFGTMKHPSVVSKKETCVSLYWINKKAHSKGFSWTCVHRVIYYISAEKAKQNHFKTTTFLHFPT